MEIYGWDLLFSILSTATGFVGGLCVSSFAGYVKVPQI